MPKSVDPCGCEHDAMDYRLTRLCDAHRPPAPRQPICVAALTNPCVIEAMDRAAEAWAPLWQQWAENMRKG